MDVTVSIRMPQPTDFRCCGCGAASIDNVKPCNCATGVGFRVTDGTSGSQEYTVFISKVQAARLALSETIKTRILGIRPEDQDIVLEADDWFHIIAALEGDRP